MLVVVFKYIVFKHVRWIRNYDNDEGILNSTLEKNQFL